MMMMMMVVVVVVVVDGTSAVLPFIVDHLMFVIFWLLRCHTQGAVGTHAADVAGYGGSCD
jgi:hypothetical protein